MNSRQIECFLETARELNFTKAAENLYLPQPAVSRYIAGLESELGTELFIRENNRKIYLSEHGKSYFNMFQRFMIEFQNTKKRINMPLRPLRLGYNIGWNISSFLPEVIANCKNKYDDFSISIECMGFHDLLDSLSDNRLDAILTLENYPEHLSKIESERVTTTQRIIIYSERLASHEQISSPADFYPYDFFLVDDPRLNHLSREIEEYFQPYHFVPKLKTVSNMATVIASVENGLGVALLDKWGQNINSPGMKYQEMDSYHPVCLAWRAKSEMAGVQIIKEELVNYFAER